MAKQGFMEDIDNVTTFSLGSDKINLKELSHDYTKRINELGKRAQGLGA